MNESVERWLRQAEHDLESAEKNFGIELYDVCLILCQQAVEKALKALYIHQHHEVPPRVHSLSRLVELTGLPAETLIQIEELDSYYFLLRYPEIGDGLPFEMCDREDAVTGLERARELMDAVRRRL